MNIVFFGSSRFAVPVLKALLTSRHKVACVLTQPDKQKGRGLHFAGTVIKAMALESGIRIYQPDNVNASDTVKFLKDLNPDLFVVIAYGQILSGKILDIPKIFSINIHASLLPRYRGAAPINWAIIRGEETTGITIIKMAKEMDAGPIILQKDIEISNLDTALTLEDKLSEMAMQFILTVLSSIEDNNYNLMPQDEDNISLAPKLKKEDGRIEWNKAAQDIYNLIRGCISWPGAFTYYNGKLLKIYKARVCPPPPNGGVPPEAAFARLPATAEWRGAARGGICPLPGEIITISKEGIVVATGKDNLIIEELQIEGKRRMKVEEFIAGHKVDINQIFDKK